MKRFASLIAMVATIGVSSAQTAPCPALDSLSGLLATCGVPADSSITGALAAAASGPTALYVFLALPPDHHRRVIAVPHCCC